MMEQQTVTDVEQTMQICPLNWQCSDRECTMAHTSPPSYQTIPPQFAVNPYYNNGYHYNFRVPAPSLAPISHPGVASWNHYNRSMYPSKPCKFGFHCHNPNCNYIHPNYSNFAAGSSPADGFDPSSAAVPSHSSPNSTTDSNPTDEVTYSTDDALTNGQQPQPEGTNPSANGGHVYSHSSTVLCKYGTACRYPNCRFVHPQGVASSGGAPAVPRGHHYPFSAYLYTGDRPIPLCRYGTNCLNQNCMFTHPERANQQSQEGANLDSTSEVGAEVIGDQQHQANEQQDQQPQARVGEVWGGAGKNQRQQQMPQHQQAQPVSAEEDAQSDWPLPSTASNPQAAKKVCRYGTNCRNASSGKCKFVHHEGTDANANDTNGNTNQNGANGGNGTAVNNNHNSYHPHHHNYNNNKSGYHNRGFANHNHHHQNNSMSYQNHSNQGNFHNNNTNGLINNNNSHFNNRGKFFNHNNNGNNTNRNRGGGHRPDGSNGIRKSPIGGGGGAGGGILCRYGTRCRNKNSGIGCKFLHAESDGALSATVVDDIENGMSGLELNGGSDENIKNVGSPDQSSTGGVEDGKRHQGEAHHATHHVSEGDGAHAVENVAGVSAHQHANSLAQ